MSQGFESLRNEFTDISPERVTAFGEAEFDRLRPEARITEFIPVLVSPLCAGGPPSSPGAGTPFGGITDARERLRLPPTNPTPSQGRAAKPLAAERRARGPVVPASPVADLPGQSRERPLIRRSRREGRRKPSCSAGRHRRKGDSVRGGRRAGRTPRHRSGMPCTGFDHCADKAQVWPGLARHDAAARVAGIGAVEAEANQRTISRTSSSARSASAQLVQLAAQSRHASTQRRIAIRGQGPVGSGCAFEVHS